MVRLTLRKRDLAPLPLRPFLDYATQCLFLRQVGDGYLFVHLSLLEFSLRCGISTTFRPNGSTNSPP
jgi:hypothetical protein